jgi:tripartite ATP-independent transporter DctM subunit
MSLEILGLILLGCLLIVIFAGFPISFTLIILATVFGFIGIGEKVFDLMTFQVFLTMVEQILAAVTLFLFMGYLLERAGLMERLFRAFQLLCGSLKGSLYLASIVTATIFAAATGIVGASVTIIGIMAAPRMRKCGYSVRLSAGTIAAGGTLGILIPPSVMLVVMGPVLEVSVVRLFAGAILPGLLLSSLFITYTMLRSFLQPELGPPLPAEERDVPFSYVAREFCIGLIPPLALIVATLGSILSGFAAPTEGAAIGVLGAVLVALAHRRLNFQMLKESVFRTAETASMIMILIAASNFFGAVFSRFGTPQFIAETLLRFELPPLAFLVFVLLIVFILGWPLEWVPIVVIVLPIFLPLIRELGVPMLTFGILVAVTLQTAWLSPPVALSAYFLKGVVPEWDLKDIYLGMMPFMALQLLGVLILLFFPAIILILPRLLYG